MQHISDGEHDGDEHPTAARSFVMLGAFRRAPTMNPVQWSELKRRYKTWREQRLTPFVSVLADVVLRSLGVET